MRVIGAWNAIIPCGPLAAATADAVISEQVAFFHRLSSARDARRDGNGAADPPPLGDSPEVEWKVYGHDRPADLGARLAAAGFESDEPETLMVFDLRGGLPDVPNDGTIARGIDVRRVTDAPGLADLTEAARAAFGRDPAWRAERMKQYERQLADPAVSFYVVHAAGRPVASARVDFPRGRSFAGLWGGGTVPTYRGRGIYRALVRVRAEEARRRGYRYLRVDARETSRPILDRLGFMPLARIVEWRLRL